MTRRGRRRLVLLAALLVLIAAGSVGGYSLLKWRRAQAIVTARTSGLEAYSEGRHADVLEILGPHVRSLDQDAEVVRALATSRRLEELPDGGHLKGAAALYRRAADLDREDLESRLALLELLPALGLLPEAIIASEEVLAIDPLNREGLEARVRAFAAMGRWDEAVELAGQLIELDPEDARWRQLQVSAAYSAGLESNEVVELVERWPALPGSEGLDRAIRGAILIRSGNVEAANELFVQAAALGAADEASLEDLIDILGDARRPDLAIEVLGRYGEAPGYSGAAAVVAADWAMRQGEREWLAAMLDTATLPEDVASVFASRVAIFELLGGTEPLDERLALVRGHLSRLGEASAAEGLRQLVDGVALLEADDAEFDSYLEELDRRAGFQSTLATVLCQIRKHPGVSEWIEAASVLPPSLIVSAIEVRQLEVQGRRIEAIRSAIELASAFRTRGEPVVLLATLWATTPGIPADVETQLRELALGADAFEFISKLCEDRGYDRTTAVPYIAAAIGAEAWLEVEQAVDRVLETLEGDVPLLVEIHNMLADDAPELAERVLAALRSAAPGDPRVLALTWTPGDTAGVPLEVRRRDLPLDSEDPEERRLAWLVLLGNIADVDGSDYLELAGEAVAANLDAPDILARVANDARAWSDTEFVRSVIDRIAETSPDSIGLDLLEARWALRTEVSDEVFDATLARLDERYLGGNRSIAVATTMLEMLLSRDDASPEAIVRLGRQILQDHPEAIEIYPVLISVMQDAGMLADADTMLREFESIDRRGVLSGRQRVVQSLRTGDFGSTICIDWPSRGRRPATSATRSACTGGCCRRGRRRLEPCPRGRWRRSCSNPVGPTRSARRSLPSRGRCRPGSSRSLR
jgi:tetratricopeptide (TPR) repeat protein